MKDGHETKKTTELTDLEVPLDGEAGPKDEDAPQTGLQLKDVLSEEEMGLFNELLRRVERTDELDKELNIDISQFTERVESVVDSIGRIEKIERTQMERLLYKEGIVPVEGADVGLPNAEPISDAPIGPGPDGGGLSISIMETFPGPEMQMEVGPGEPYSSVRAGGPAAPRYEMPLVNYSANLDTVLVKLRKLAELKFERSELNEARGLVGMAMKVGGRSETFRKEFATLLAQLGMESEPEGSEVTAPHEDARSKVEELTDVEEAKVLAPELAGQIGSLQKRARSSLNQLKQMLDGSKLSEDDREKVSSLYHEANALFKDNRFHKAHQVALSALNTIKERVKDNIDLQLQNDLYQARELLDEMARSEQQYDVIAIEEQREQLDRAMKFYLTNEYERANLLVKTVMAALKEMKEPEGSRTKERAQELKMEVALLKEQNIDLDGLKEAEELTRSIEELLMKRDYSSCTRLMDTLSSMVTELKEKGDTYSRSKEMTIRLTNRISRLSQGGDYDLREVEKKLSYMKGYFTDGRYEDALLIGAEIEVYLESMENLKKEMEAKEVFTELENLMLHVEEMEDAPRLRDEFGVIRSKYVIGEHGYVKAQGKELLETMRKKTKSLTVERAKRISSAVIESKLLSMKLRSMNMDTTEHDRAARKARTLIKEGSPVEGLRQLDRVNAAMREELQQRTDFLRNYVSIYRDTLEVLLDRHRAEPITYYIRNKQVPILRRMEQLGRLNKALESYRKLVNRFSQIKVTLDKRSQIESNLMDLRYELYKRKDLGMDITEPLSIYNQAQRHFSEGKVILAEFLAEVTKRYYERFLPVD